MKYRGGVSRLQAIGLSVALFCLCDCCLYSTVYAQQTNGTPPGEDALRDQQLSISGRYSRFERMLSQMADILGREDPERADLLRRAISKGREQRIGDRIDGVIELLESKEFGTAIEEQQQVADGLIELLKLLQSEDRRSSVEKERERLNDLLNDVRGLINEQRSARSANQNSPVPSSAAPQQQKAIDNAESMLDQIEKDDAEKATGDPSGSDPSGVEQKDGEQKDGLPGEHKSPEQGDAEQNDSDENKSQDGDQKSGEPQQGQPGDSSGDQKQGDQKQGDQKQGDQKQGDQNQGSQQSQSQNQSSSENEKQQTPGRPEIEQARNLMQEALDQLRQQQKQAALQKQDEAIDELQEAAAKLEEMLRQLREEEKEMLLAALEARYQRMLSVQTQIHEGTLELAATPKENWLDQYFGRCRELAQQQLELTSECAQTVNLLREDGTSVSILLSLEDIESDMGQVSEYLRESKVGGLTQSVQTDVIEALKELIEATQKEMQEMKSEERQQQQQQQSNNSQKPPLVELMAEIRVLRSLQVRVNRRTRQVDGLLLQADRDQQADLNGQLTELAERQQRLIESAGELARQMQRQQ